MSNYEVEAMRKRDRRDGAPEGFSVAVVLFFGAGFYAGVLVTLLAMRIFS